MTSARERLQARLEATPSKELVDADTTSSTPAGADGSAPKGRATAMPGGKRLKSAPLGVLKGEGEKVAAQERSQGAGGEEKVAARERSQGAGKGKKVAAQERSQEDCRVVTAESQAWLRSNVGEDHYHALLTDVGGEWTDAQGGWRGTAGVSHWAEWLRVCRPGAMATVFVPRKHQHLATMAAEAAGWEWRDTLVWLYPGGQVDAIDAGRAVDKRMGGEGTPWFRLLGAATDEQREELKRSVQANPWWGWGTGLRPAWEPILLLRKPLEGSLVDNLLEWGTGALNIDATRIPSEARSALETRVREGQGGAHGNSLSKSTRKVGTTTLGRWGANALVGACDPCGGAGCGKTPPQGGCPLGELVAQHENAARYHYCPKTSQKEKHMGGQNPHHHVRPGDLMGWLWGLVVPPYGDVLDPLGGTGSTGLGVVRLDGGPLGQGGGGVGNDPDAVRLDGGHLTLVEWDAAWAGLAVERLRAAGLQVSVG